MKEKIGYEDSFEQPFNRIRGIFVCMVSNELKTHVCNFEIEEYTLAGAIAEALRKHHEYYPDHTLLSFTPVYVRVSDSWLSVSGEATTYTLNRPYGD